MPDFFVRFALFWTTTGRWIIPIRLPTPSDRLKTVTQKRGGEGGNCRAQVLGFLYLFQDFLRLLSILFFLHVSPPPFYVTNLAK